jgi:hypothetical protein
MTSARFGASLLGLTVLAAAATQADTLVLRDGRRIDGELIAVRGDTVEFEEQRLFGGRRAARFDRSEVRRIELDERSGDRSSDDGGGGGYASERPRGLREKEVNVAADVAWTDTGIDVRSGQALYFNGSGRIRWGKDRRDGPEGEGGSHHNPNRPIPSRPGAALIGKIGSGSDVFFIGKDDGAIRMRGSGRLYLGVNDDYLLDNSGSFQVTVFY